ncbi:MAG: glycoside hydrolase family 9 protein [Ruminococcus sp.]|nr:glycoside hydrolase family 9 protein [Ruminococcus sp.]
MLKEKLGKKIAALVSAVVMAVTASVTGMSAIASLTASAGVETGEGTFEGGKALPWHICESATASMKFDITDGIYAIYLEKVGGVGEGGEGRWDCQFRHRNLTIDEGHTYRLTFSINPSRSGTFYSKIGDMTDDQYEIWHMNGTGLSMSYTEHLSASELETQLCNASSNGSYTDYGTGWDAFKSMTVQANTWTTYAYEFKAEQSNSNHISTTTGEWTFHLGGTTPQYNQNDVCFQDDTIVLFDNLMLIDMTDNATDYVAEEDYVSTGVELNQIGYYPNAKKLATLIVDEGDTTQYDYAIKDSSGNTVYTGTTDGNVIYDEAAWNYNQVIDFTDFTEEGIEYTLEVAGKTSIAFDINQNLYETYYDESLLTYAMNFFYQARSGEETLDAYIPSGQTVGGSGVSLGRKDCHDPDTAYIADEWVYIYTSLPTYSQSIDLTGGWYDAGDYGKYIVNGGISLWTLMNMYERSIMVGKADKWDDSSGTVIIPEAGNGTPDILDECKVELDFFLKMQRDDGMVYHKMHDYKWTGLAVAPYDDDGDPSGSQRPMRIVKPVTYAATLNFAAACAQGARLFEEYDASYAATLLAAAEKAYAAAVDQYEPFSKVGFTDTGKYAPMDQDKGGGPYGDSEVSDEFYWAACELYISTGDSQYYTELKKYGTNAYGTDNGVAFGISTTLVGGENNGTCSLFTWGTLNSVGSISLYVNSEEMLEKGLLTQDEVDTLKDQVINAADFYLDIQDNSAYSTPYEGMTYDADVWSYDKSSGTGSMDSISLTGGYEWGSNSMVINNTIAMALAYDETQDVKYVDGVTTAFDYLMGRNSIEQSYVTGYGEHSTQYPHHRWWSGQLDSNNFPYAPYGVLSGGPNSNMNDPMVQGRGYKIGGIAPMACYLDNVEAWSVNECTINWNSPLCWVVSFIDDEAPNIVRDASSTTTTKTTTTTTTTTTTETTAATDTDTSSDVTTATTADIDTTDVTTTTATTSGDTSSTSGGKLGDVNLDGVVNMADTILLNKYVAGSVDFIDQQVANGDCYYDGAGDVNNNDALSLLKFQVQALDSLPEK